MTQARGILPRDEDRDVLYKNPRTCGYFVGVSLDPEIDRPRVEAWLETVSRLVDQVVARSAPKHGAAEGEKIAAVAVGFARRFFVADGQPRFAIDPPVGLAADALLPHQVAGPLAGVPVMDVDVLFYVASVFEARVSAFLSGLAALGPDVQALTLDRGYQRPGETEPFGYRDGLRNIVPATARAPFVFVHRHGSEPDEPEWTDGGSYMAYLRIVQHRAAFAALKDDAARDAVIGRTKDGTRVDLVGRGVRPRDELWGPPPSPPTSHVAKAGPRGIRDSVQIFRRSLPFLETTTDGQVRVGLNFCSFQATLEQFDVIVNDWMLSRQFPTQPGGTGPGMDALLDPEGGLTTIEKQGYFFVPPYAGEGLRAALLDNSSKPETPRSGRIVVRQRVVDAGDATRRFERRGFRFEVLDDQGRVVPGSEFETDSTGRGQCAAEIRSDRGYTLQQTYSPLGSPLVSRSFGLDRRRQTVRVTSTVVEPDTPYGA